jgi:hypothetical protein
LAGKRARGVLVRVGTSAQIRPLVGIRGKRRQRNSSREKGFRSPLLYPAELRALVPVTCGNTLTLPQPTRRRAICNDDPANRCSVGHAQESLRGWRLELGHRTVVSLWAVPGPVAQPRTHAKIPARRRSQPRPPLSGGSKPNVPTSTAAWRSTTGLATDRCANGGPVTYRVWPVSRHPRS